MAKDSETNELPTTQWPPLPTRWKRDVQIPSVLPDYKIKRNYKPRSQGKVREQEFRKGGVNFSPNNWPINWITTS